MLSGKILFYGLLSTLAGAHLVAQAPESIGILRSVTGPVILTPANGAVAKKPIRLTSSSVLRSLYDGDTLQAEPQGEVTVVISGRTRAIALKGNRPVQLHPDHPATPNELEAFVAIKKFGGAGGSRQIAGLLWWPADQASVRARGFQIRWNPSPVAGSYTFALSSEGGETIWSSGHIDSASGRMSAEQDVAIEQVLLQNQNQTARQNYTITVSAGSQGEVRTTFSVLSKTEEAQIEAELQRWDISESDPLLRVLGRAATLKTANLACELADEYDAALSLAPDSTALLGAALGADKAIGNVVRSRELAARLRTETSTQP